MNRIINAVLERYFSLFGGAHPLVSMLPLGIATGVAMLLVIRYASDQTAVRAVRRRVQAHLLELRLFAEDPRLVWRAQKDLARANLRYLRLMLVPALLTVPPMLVLLAHLDRFYGRQALPVGQASLITLQLSDGVRLESSRPLLVAPPGIAVETPPVRVWSERQISWRLRPQRELSGRMVVLLPDGQVEKSISAGAGLRSLSSRRVRSMPASFLHPGESRLPGGVAEWIEIRYPSREIQAFGLEFGWLVWFLAISMTSALLLKRRFGLAL